MTNHRRHARRHAPVLLLALVTLMVAVATRMLSLATLLVSLATLTAVAPPASAHASLVRSSPADRSSVATPPTTLTLTFDENMGSPAVILVTDADGASVVRGKALVAVNVVRTGVRLAASGDYTVVYRVVSADGHPVSGRLSFSVGGRTASPGRVTAAPASVGHQDGSGSTGPPTRVIGMIAALALLGGIGLLTVRRWAPDLWSGS